MNKILIAIDGSESALKAVDYVGHQFSGTQGLRITLLHVLPYVPTSLWDDGHILTRQEIEDRKKLFDSWARSQQLKLEPIFRSATDVLVRLGISPEQIETKGVSDSADAAQSILEEARDGGYRTLVLGRRGLSPAKRIFMGSVTSKIINHGAGIAICVVE
ncbi:MAG TPA: universal stress protein [Thermodesulfovibrionales bacterium]|nr:universal stress protein [Thermodesulfovibrionales bacterium]